MTVARLIEMLEDINDKTREVKIEIGESGGFDINYLLEFSEFNTVLLWSDGKKKEKD